MINIAWLIIGDVLALAIVTMIGFATHGETGVSLLPRMLTTFGPLTLGWFLIAPFMGLFKSEITANPRQLWRPILAMIRPGRWPRSYALFCSTRLSSPSLALFCAPPPGWEWLSGG
jgi:hypothetical protein